ncbi:MAG: Gfo/Idh/MocA family oxidoreductase [Candidatus Saccharimonas sp.]
MRKSILFIGLGLHSRRIQFPYVIRKSKELGVDDVVILDIPSKKDEIGKYLNNSSFDGVKTHKYYTNKYIDVKLLDYIVEKHAITHVILGTDPEHHFEYAKYLISKSLKVIMDKPIVAIPNAITDIKSADLILSQFDELRHLYELHPQANVVVLSQRRYHPAYKKIADDILENFERTGIVPHYFYLFHSDGQLRILDEIDHISYHGFNRGYGKVSHSGYHFIDTLYLYLKPFIAYGTINNFALSAHHLSPADYSHQLNEKVVKRIFSQENDIPPYEASSAGEIDAYITIQFKKDDRLVATARIDMLHSGFSDRINFSPNKSDLYKGNGRIRHEKQIVMQGPIYAAYIDSLQSKQINLNTGDSLTALGGEHHFELIRFNHASSGKQVVTRKGINDLMNIKDLGYSRGHQEEARYYSLTDFFSTSDKNERSKDSDLSDHRVSSLIMSSIYSAISSQKVIEGRISI